MAHLAASSHLLLSVLGPQAPCSILPTRPSVATAGSAQPLAHGSTSSLSFFICPMGAETARGGGDPSVGVCRPGTPAPACHGQNQAAGLWTCCFSDVSMTTRALEELDGGLGSCQVEEDRSALPDPCSGRPREDRAQAELSGGWDQPGGFHDRDCPSFPANSDIQAGRLQQLAPCE
ncbi:hypothetical protein J1605_015674 [Eschrichtius robustus]|uniref:Uncharacterized protein n=1 Tax=Eschrichtius robustus TaxID=9764 RepID=A0AB34GBY4_ESCRO|nr:hypothetical protein J1605_015674 [Eschrichtius robustus]